MVLPDNVALKANKFKRSRDATQDGFAMCQFFNCALCQGLRDTRFTALHVQEIQIQSFQRYRLECNWSELSGLSRKGLNYGGTASSNSLGSHRFRVFSGLRPQRWSELFGAVSFCLRAERLRANRW